MPDTELRAADHILWASAPATRALYEGHGLWVVALDTGFEKLEGA